MPEGGPAAPPGESPSRRDPIRRPCSTDSRPSDEGVVLAHSAP